MKYVELEKYVRDDFAKQILSKNDKHNYWFNAFFNNLKDTDSLFQR